LVEQNIIHLCIRGDREATKSLYQECAPYVYAIIKNYFVEDVDRKDAMQEVFAQVYLSLKNFDFTKGSFQNWLSKLAVNQCATLIRKSKKISFVYSLETMDTADEVSTEFMNHLNVTDLENMLKNMPVGYKTIFLLSVIDEYNHKEISELLGISQETSRSQLFRALKWIKNNILTDSKMVQYGLF
jgi:RNA polymerase sigma-70 factor (ECF subfamily)